MIIEPGLALLAVIGFVAYAVRGITGAGSAIVFNALFGVAFAFGLTGELTLLDGLYWIALTDLVASTLMFIALRREIVLEPFVKRLLLVAVPFLVVFALVLPRIEVQLLTFGLGLVLVASGLYLGLRPTLSKWTDKALMDRAAPTGVLAGILAGLYGMPGPVFMIYVAHAGPETSLFRMRSIVISGTTSTVRGVTFIVAGTIGTEGAIRFGLTLPVILIGLGVGLWLHPKIGPRAFRFGLGLLIMVAGVILLVRTLMG